MENLANIQKETYAPSTELISHMINIGFDFGLTGTKYIYELYVKHKDNLFAPYDNLFHNLSSLADRHNIKLKSLDRDVRWSIDRFINKDEFNVIILNQENTHNKKIALSEIFNIV